MSTAITQRAQKSVCVCVCVRERERERGRQEYRNVKGHGHHAELTPSMIRKQLLHSGLVSATTCFTSASCAAHNLHAPGRRIENTSTAVYLVLPHALLQRLAQLTLYPAQVFSSAWQAHRKYQPLDSKIPLTQFRATGIL
jgi:hypothetical protein